MNYNSEKLKEEKEELVDVDPLLLIEYIKSSIEILINIKIEEKEKEMLDMGIGKK